jgi:uncharacterized protein (AIM24 family)
MATAPAAQPAAQPAAASLPLPVESFIYGDEVDCLQLLLQPCASVIAPSGAFVSHSKGVIATSAFQRNTAYTVFKWFGDPFLHYHSTWTNTSATPASLGIGTPCCCKIVHLDLAVTGPVVVAVQSLLCLSSSAVVDLQRRVLAATPRLNPTGQMRVKQVSGVGNLFMTAAGMAVSKELAAGEALIVAVDRVIGCSASCTVVTLPQQPAQLLRPQLRPQAEFTGPGTVYMQTCPPGNSTSPRVELNIRLGRTITLAVLAMMLHSLLMLWSLSTEQVAEALNNILGGNVNNDG